MELFVGFDSRLALAHRVCAASVRHPGVRVRPLVADELRAAGLYQRPVSRRAGGLFDDLSQAPMSTEFAFTRFLVPALTTAPWALYCDSDFLWRRINGLDIRLAWAPAMDKYAVMVVKHDHIPQEASKMDGQPQSAYPRKNWSSLILWNCRHPANRGMAARVNVWRGLDLHQFAWLDDSQIGSLPPECNWLEGISDPDIDPVAVHYTRGTPDLPGYESAAYAEEWRALQRTLH